MMYRVIDLKRFFIAYFLILLVTFSVVVFLISPSGSNQRHLEVDLKDLVANVEDFHDMKIRTRGTVNFWASFYMYEDFWLSSDTQGECGIPVVVRDAELSVPSENSSIEVLGAIRFSELEGGFFYLNATSWDYAENIVSGTGTIVFMGFEGGFYGIISDDGEHYDSVNLDRRFRVDGLRVRFEVRLLQDVLSVHMWGKLVSILHIERFY
jgi:hypothetical protein